MTHVGENCMKEIVGCVISTKEITDIYKQTKEIQNHEKHKYNYELRQQSRYSTA